MAIDRVAPLGLLSAAGASCALAPGEEIPVFHHVGVYAYRRAALAAYGDWAVGRLETWEGLEQLRFMENGVPVTCVEVDARGRAFWELNNPTDVPRIEAVYLGPGEVLVAADVRMDPHLSGEELTDVLARIRSEARRELPVIARLYLTPVQGQQRMST